MLIRLTGSDMNEMLWERAIPQGFVTADGLEESSFHMKHPLLDLDGKGMCLDGIHLGFSEWQQKQDMELQLHTDLPYFEMHFNVAGSHSAIVQGSRKPIAFAPGEHNMFCLPACDRRVTTFSQIQPARAFRIKFTQSYMADLARDKDSPLFPLLDALVHQQWALLGPQNRPITPRMDAVIRDIFYCTRRGLLKRLFIESKVLELLMLQLEQFSPADLPQTVFSTYDVGKLHQAKRLVEQNISHPYSLKELALLAGLNEFKLKKGFRQVFGHSVFGYLHECRMQEAKRLLADHGMPIGEVAQYCGYQHVQHFSTAFKKKFGVTPGKFR